MNALRVLAAAGLVLVAACGSTSGAQSSPRGAALSANGRTPAARTPTASGAPVLPAAGTRVAGPNGFPPAVSIIHLTQTVKDFRGTGLRMDPLLPGHGPTVAAATAYAVCATERSNPCDRQVGPTMVPGLASGTEGGTVRANGSVQPAFDHRLIWTLSWPNEMCVLQPEPSPFQAYNSVSEVPCIRTMLVDATTGRYLGTYSVG